MFQAISIDVTPITFGDFFFFLNHRVFFFFFPATAFHFCNHSNGGAVTMATSWPQTLCSRKITQVL